MSDVRAQLVRTMGPRLPETWDSGVLADAILARFDVVEKPVVTDEELGQFVRTASEFLTNSGAGGRLRTYLAEAGLTIVRIEEAG